MQATQGWRGFLLAAFLCASFAAFEPAAAASPSAPGISLIVINAQTGAVLDQFDAEAPRYPASLTKLMTLYLCFEALRDHRITLNEEMPVSYHAASREPMKLDLVPGSRITVAQAILAIVTLSANDAASALGEFLGGGSESRFAEIMTQRAHAMGMTETTFRNASGLPAPGQLITARDLAILARRLVLDFPQYYPFFSAARFVFHGRVLINHDEMLHLYPGADGMKTGYTSAAGFTLVTSAVRNGVRLISVVLHARSVAERDRAMIVALNQSFALGTSGFAGIASRAGTALASALLPAARAATLPQPARPSPPAVSHVVDTVSLAASWSVELTAALTTSAAARSAALTARALIGSGMALALHIAFRNQRFWRGDVGGLTEAQAYSACGVLDRQRIACVVLRPSNREFALR